MNLSRLGLCVAVAGLALAGCRDRKLTYRYTYEDYAYGPADAISQTYEQTYEQAYDESDGTGQDVLYSLNDSPEEVLYSDADDYDQAYDQGYQEGLKRAAEAAGLIDPNTRMDSKGNVLTGAQEGQTHIEDVIPNAPVEQEDEGPAPETSDDWIDQRGWTTVEPAPATQPEPLDPEVYVSDDEVVDYQPVYVEVPVVVTRYVVVRDWAPVCNVGFGLSYWHNHWRWGIFRPSWWYPSSWSLYDPWCMSGYDFRVPYYDYGYDYGFSFGFGYDRGCYYGYRPYRSHGLGFSHRLPFHSRFDGGPRTHLALARPLVSPSLLPYARRLNSFGAIHSVGGLSRPFGRRQTAMRSLGGTAVRPSLLTGPARSTAGPTVLGPRQTTRSFRPTVSSRGQTTAVQAAAPSSKAIGGVSRPSVRIRRPLSSSDSPNSTLGAPMRTPQRPTILRTGPSQRFTGSPKSGVTVPPSTRSGPSRTFTAPPTPPSHSTLIPSFPTTTRPPINRPSTMSGPSRSFTAQPTPPSHSTLIPSRPTTATPPFMRPSTRSGPLRTFTAPPTPPSHSTLIPSPPASGRPTVIYPSTRSGPSRTFTAPPAPSRPSMAIPSRPTAAPPSAVRPSTRSGQPRSFTPPPAPSRREISVPSTRSLPSRTIERSSGPSFRGSAPSSRSGSRNDRDRR